MNKKILYFKDKLNFFTEIDIYLFLFLLINPIVTLFMHLFPFIVNILPDNSIFILRFLLLAIPIYKKKKDINILSIFILACLGIVILLSCINTANISMIKQIFLNGEQILLFLLFIYISNIDSPRVIMNTYINLSYLIVPLLLILALSGYYGEYAQFRYMEFSHTIIIYWCFMIQDSFIHKKTNLIYLLYLIIVTLFIGLLSNRAILINITLSLLIFFNLYIRDKKLKKRIDILILSMLSIVILFFKQIKNILLLVLSLFNVNSYSLMTLELGTFFMSSSRKNIWANCMNSIIKHPLLGTGIGSDRVINGSVGAYAHNFLIELWVDFGIIFGSLLCFFYFKALYSFFKKANDVWKNVIIPFLINAILILMLSKSIYILPELWITIGLLCAFFKNSNLTKIIRRKKI